ncbi:ABC transporter substrate-binding protein [Pseudonocardia endophytica]|uniref:Peptide/nickel transport system substrate-binding protein n=1 Tax=Pseudonocardia endophytica TaxID=401976 RepID=A0A4R1HNA7_PSEEN|nr:ABC transporter substrate-binding protein [Pseudonocardia endophytica]TCK22075.1 peptide/nickel transport system substrate-binding protein [Pseudonocardia endophytica]
MTPVRRRHLRRRLFRQAAATAVLGLLVAGCSSEASVGSGDAGGPPEPGGTLTIALPSDPTCLDPQQTGQLASTEISRSLVDTLTDQDPRTGKIVPWLAESFTASPDTKSFSFVLREGVTFSDGTPVDSAAVKATFDKLVGLPSTGAPAYLKGYTGTTVTDARHFTVGFGSPNAQFLQATSIPGFGILSPATANTPLADRCRGQYVGSGPFVLDHYTPDQEVVLRKRPDYKWPSQLSPNTGAAYVDEAKFLFVPEAGARSGALSSGQVQVAEQVQPTDQDQFRQPGFRLLDIPTPGVVPPLSLNHVGPLADEKVRKALLIGIDRQELVNTVFGSTGKPATSVLAASTPYYTDQSTYLRYDPAQAGALLDAAGWVQGPDGIRIKDGKRLTLNWLIPAPTPPANEPVQQQLRKIGVEVRLNPVAPPKYVEQQQKGQFDLTAVAVTRADPDILRNLFFTGGANLWHLPPSQLDGFLTQQAGANNEQARQEAVTKAVQWILEHADTVPLYETTLIHAVSDDAHDLRADGSTRLALQSAWVSG